MIINKKKYEKINNDLVDIKVKAFNDVKKALDGENKIMRLCLQIKEQRDQYKAERDTLIDDLTVLKANISRLERENHDFKKRNALLMNTVDDLDKENKALRLQSNTYFDECKNEKLTSQGLRDQCKEYAQEASKYTTLTDHIRLKAENNPGVSRYIDLVNYIDRLEEKESDTTHHIPHLTNININDNTEEPMKFIKRIAKGRD
ncbi:hypothetical protein NGH32_07220 [Staphylococcus xylosus]|uniref:hypothetical protein n=1 Tax=Staphylococcus xylosus TaxID=1288 RepID=UPI002DBDDF9F|nr:hypothetical protein [Staphylococcus xylosus]MEB8150491.1 hypothetical protein [Staphylococcus xylosus]